MGRGGHSKVRFPSGRGGRNIGRCRPGLPAAPWPKSSWRQTDSPASLPRQPSQTRPPPRPTRWRQTDSPASLPRQPTRQDPAAPRYSPPATCRPARTTDPRWPMWPGATLDNADGEIAPDPNDGTTRSARHDRTAGPAEPAGPAWPGTSPRPPDPRRTAGPGTSPRPPNPRTRPAARHAARTPAGPSRAPPPGARQRGSRPPGLRLPRVGPRSAPA